MSRIKNHDLNLSSWGPYTKKYIGISHIPDTETGKRFDLSIFPGLHRRGLAVPNVLWETNYHPWEASADLTYYSNRHQLLWKDKIYSDISYSVLNDSEVLFSCRNVNNTKEKQALVYHHAASLHFPAKEAYSTEELIPYLPPHEEGYKIIDALAYHSLSLNDTHPARTLSPDGIIWGEKRDNGFTRGAGLAAGFGREKGNRVDYDISPYAEMGSTVYLRYKIPSGQKRFIKTEGAIERDSSLIGTGDFETIRLGTVTAGSSLLSVDPQGSGELELDCLVISAPGQDLPPRFVCDEADHVPEIIERPTANTLMLKYKGIDLYYGIAWSPEAVVREFQCDDLDCLMKYNVHEHNYRRFKGEGNGHYTEIFTRPIYLTPQSETVLFGKVCYGSPEKLRAILGSFDPNGEENRVYYERFRSKKVSFEEENPYSFSLERLAATSLTNVVYPVRVQGTWVRHHTPGRWWDSLYTWDSGFIGLGFSTFSKARAEETLNAYVTLPGNDHAAFIHHGSPVQTQFYLYQDIFNRSASLDFLRKYYHQMLQYHRFMTGRAGSSTIARLKSGLLKTWDYFYSAGGWDDYPAQVHIRKKGLEKSVAPVITTAMGIRSASILKGAAEILGENTDELNRDIERLKESLQRFSWDRESGYFSAVCHDPSGNALHPLVEEGGANFNMGFDGIYPINSGICDDHQRERILEKMFSPLHLWTACGLTAVDRAAPYFRDDGYWNGTVWLSHQWVFWKTMLDIGKGEEAYKIARTALHLWKKQVEASYNCFEHFVTETGQGSGWHHFGGLSSPVLNWFSAYYAPGTLSGGHDSWFTETKFTNDKKSLLAKVRFVEQSSSERTIIVALNRNVREVRVEWNREPIPYKIRLSGTIEITVHPQYHKESTLEIKELKT